MSKIVWDSQNKRYVLDVDAKWKASITVQFAGDTAKRVILHEIVGEDLRFVLCSANCLVGKPEHPVIVSASVTYQALYDAASPHKFCLIPKKLIAGRTPCSSAAADYELVTPATNPMEDQTGNTNHVKVINQVFNLGGGESITVTIHLENASGGGV